MSDIRYFTKAGCLSPEAFKAIRKEDLCEENWELIDEHIKECEFCSEALEGILLSESFDQSLEELQDNITKKSIAKQLNLGRVLPYIAVAASAGLLFVVYSVVINYGKNSYVVENDITEKVANEDFYRPLPDTSNYPVASEEESYLTNNEKKVLFSGSKSSGEKYSDVVFTFVEQMPEFPGGIVELDEFIKKEVARAEKEYGIRSCGKVMIGFMVDNNGKVKNPVIVDGGSRKLNKIAVSIIKKLPNWKPGYQSGEAVNVSFTLPVRFENC